MTPREPVEEVRRKRTVRGRIHNPNGPSRSAPERVKLRIYGGMYKLDPVGCPCDVDLVSYLTENSSPCSVFHYGTGGHHHVGVKLGSVGYDVFGITNSVLEFDTYRTLITENPSLTNYYHVLFGDIYTLNINNLPRSDIVTMFHLGEYGGHSAEYARHSERTLLDMFIDNVMGGAPIIFFPGSHGWGIARPLVHAAEQEGRIRSEREYKSLLIYRKC